MRHLLLSLLCLPVVLFAQNTVDTGHSVDQGEDTSEMRDRGIPFENTGFWIAPNPSVEFMDIYASGMSGEVSVHVFTLVGRKLCSFKPQDQNGDLLLHADVTSWLPGTYLVRLEQNGTVVKTMRFIRR